VGIVPAVSETKDNISKLPKGGDRARGRRVINFFLDIGNGISACGTEQVRCGKAGDNAGELTWK
jgi:hypothetical protein